MRRFPVVFRYHRGTDRCIQSVEGVHDRGREGHIGRSKYERVPVRVGLERRQNFPDPVHGSFDVDTGLKRSHPGTPDPAVTTAGVAAARQRRRS